MYERDRLRSVVPLSRNTTPLSSFPKKKGPGATRELGRKREREREGGNAGTYMINVLDVIDGKVYSVKEFW